MDTRRFFIGQLRGLLRAYLAILIALYPAIVLTGLGWMIVAGALRGAEGVESIPVSLAWMLVFGLIFGIPLAFVFSLLALPFLMLRRFVVGRSHPWLKPGYLAVALYGPALIAVMSQGWSNDDWPAIWLYEAIALIATAIYVRITTPTGPFGTAA